MMKVLKYLFTVLLVLICFSNIKEVPMWYQNSLIEVYFSNKLDIADLAKIRADLSDKGFKLNYDYLKFGENGKLSAIKYFVKADKFGGG